MNLIIKQSVPSDAHLAWRKPGTSAADGLLQEFALKVGANAGRILQAMHARHVPMDFKSYLSDPISVTWEDSWSTELSETRDPQGAEMLKQLAAELKSKNVKFTDPYFPPDATSLYVDSSRKFQDFLEGHYPSNIEWKRPEQLFPDKTLKVIYKSSSFLMKALEFFRLVTVLSVKF
jgi:hypothetical protein